MVDFCGRHFLCAGNHQSVNIFIFRQRIRIGSRERKINFRIYLQLFFLQLFNKRKESGVFLFVRLLPVRLLVIRFRKRLCFHDYTAANAVFKCRNNIIKLFLRFRFLRTGKSNILTLGNTHHILSFRRLHNRLGNRLRAFLTECRLASSRR